MISSDNHERIVLEAVTPVFIRKDRRTYEFRVSELRGVLRYWLRALLGRYLDWREVRELEAAVFGGRIDDEMLPSSVNLVLVGEKRESRGTRCPDEVWRDREGVGLGSTT
ncbi:RAMP superfamily CRISPR-associated protein [Methanopyrus kandleri]